MADGNFTNLNATGNIYARGFISAQGNVTGGNFRSNGLILATGNITGPNLLSTGNISATGTVLAATFRGDGSQLTGITSANTRSAITVTGNAQPNVTSVGTLLNLSVFGMTRLANAIATGNVQASGNVIGRNLLTSGNISAQGNISGVYITGNGALLTGVTSTRANTAVTITSSAQPNITSVGTLSSLSVYGTTSTFNLVAGGAVRATGNITGQYILGNGAFLTGISGGGSSTVAITVSGNAQPNITSVGNLTSLSVVGTINAGYIVGNGAGITGISGGGSSNRISVAVGTGAIAAGFGANVTAVGYKGYALYSVQTSTAAWVTVYSSIGARTADSSRPQSVDPVPGSGVLAEVVTTGASTQYFSPAVIGYSSEAVPDTNIQMKVVNNSSGQANVVVTLTLVKMEG